MIIDVHGHYTTAPAQLQAFRDEQLAAIERSGRRPHPPRISDEQIRDSVGSHQLTVMRERGIDLTIFSPKASGMEHHRPDEATAVDWARTSNDLVGRVVDLFPGSFAGVCQLPQTPGGGLAPSVAELRRCVGELSFVGANLNPDPSGGHWNSPPLTDPFWFPLYEVLVELDVPVMIHVSSSCNPAAHTLGAHYLNADTTVFMQLLVGDLFAMYPGLRIVIPHGGGAVPYHWGRYEGLADRLGRPPLREHLMRNVFFDTCVYHQPGIDLLTAVIDAENLLFASEMLGAVRGLNPSTGGSWDDTRRYVEAASLGAAKRQQVYQANALRVYPRLLTRLAAAGSVS